jgi:hypothetical protein
LNVGEAGVQNIKMRCLVWRVKSPIIPIAQMLGKIICRGIWRHSALGLLICAMHHCLDRRSPGKFSVFILDPVQDGYRKATHCKYLIS